jgi:single-strand DNA-binding protein
VAWGRQAETCGQYLSKGSPVFVEGRLSTRSWEDQEGQKRSMTEVVAANVQFLRGTGQKSPADQENTMPEGAPANNDIQSIDIDMNMGTPSDGDIPF